MMGNNYALQILHIAHNFIKNEYSTLRLWDTGDFKVITKCINSQRKVIKTKNAGGKRTLATTCCYSRDGKLIAAGCDDGSIQIWKNGKIFVWKISTFLEIMLLDSFPQVNTTYMCRNAHNGPITCLEFSPDNQRIVSRSCQ